MGGGVTLSEVQSAVSVLMWQTELARATAWRESAERQERFARERYTEALERVVAPVATTTADDSEPPSKRVRTARDVPGKGKGKARDVVVEELDEDEEDELTGSEVDEVES